MKYGISEALKEAEAMMESFQKDADYFEHANAKNNQRYCEGKVDGLNLFTKVLQRMREDNCDSELHNVQVEADGRCHHCESRKSK